MLQDAIRFALQAHAPKYMNKKGFSLIEVILASLIFALSVAGFYAALGSVRTPVQQTDRSLIAAQYGKEVLEDLRKDVGASNSLAEGPTVISPARVIDGVTYTATINVVTQADSSKKVDVSVVWSTP